MIEFIGALFTLLSAYYTVKEKVICWPLAIASTIIYIYLLYIEKLYGQVFVDILTLFQCAYGWYYWDKTDNKQPERLKPIKFVRDIFLLVLISSITIYYIRTYTNNPQPVSDITSTYLALLANWYLAKKFIDGFYVWVIADIILAYMFYYQHMYWSMGLFIILIGFALQGQFAWQKSLKTD